MTNGCLSTTLLIQPQRQTRNGSDHSKGFAVETQCLAQSDKQKETLRDTKEQLLKGHVPTAPRIKVWHMRIRGFYHLFRSSQCSKLVKIRLKAWKVVVKNKRRTQEFLFCFASRLCVGPTRSFQHRQLGSKTNKKVKQIQILCG